MTPQEQIHRDFERNILLSKAYCKLSGGLQYYKELLERGAEQRGNQLSIPPFILRELNAKYGILPDSNNHGVGSHFCSHGRKLLAELEEGKEIFVSEEERQERLSICINCEFYTKGKCLKAGCSMGGYVEHISRYIIEHCPLNKWREHDATLN